METTVCWNWTSTVRVKPRKTKVWFTSIHRCMAFKQCRFEAGLYSWMSLRACGVAEKCFGRKSHAYGLETTPSSTPSTGSHWCMISVVMVVMVLNCAALT